MKVLALTVFCFHLFSSFAAPPIVEIVVDGNTLPIYYIPESYTPNYVGDIMCGITKSGTRGPNKMDIYRFTSSGTYNPVYLEGCTSSSDIWLYSYMELDDPDGHRITHIYDADDQFAFGDQQGCGNQYAGDITVSNRGYVKNEYRGYSIPFDYECPSGATCPPGPTPVDVNNGDIYYFGVGAFEPGVSGSYSITLECSSGSPAKAGLLNELGFEEESDVLTWSISYNTLYLVIGVILILLLIINIYCMVKRNKSSFNNKYKNVVTYSDSDIDAESQQLK